LSSQLAWQIQRSLEERGKRTALVAGTEALSGHELRDEALALAQAVLTRGVRVGDTVGLLVDRSAGAIVAMLAALFAGCAYLPLEPAAPVAWIRHLLAATGARLLVVGSANLAAAEPLAVFLELGVLPASVRVPVRAGPERPENPTKLAYVMGTSGTTGTPKPVPIRASSLLHYCQSFAAFVGGVEALAGSRMGSVTTLAADLGNTMVFPALLYGAELHLLAEADTRDPRRFAAYVQRHGIDALKVVPTHLRVLLAAGEAVLPRRLLVVGGEPFGLDLLEQLETLAPSCAVFNHYGPTETTVGVTMYNVATKPGTAERLRAAGCRTVPVGTPLGSNRLYVVDSQGRPCDEGVAGEVLIGGPSVSEGYLGDPEMSAKRFVRMPWCPVQPLYRSGDLACVHPGGEIELLGRMDGQIKVRGHRVETGAVEEVLRSHRNVADAFVSQLREGALAGALAAWVHAQGGVTEQALRAWLLDRLPAPMVPARILVVDSLPRTANGKVDPTSLPLPVGPATQGVPVSREEAVARVFAQVLGLPPERVQQDFFQLGGDSLLALRVIEQLRDEHSLDLPIGAFYADPTPSGVARSVRPRLRSGALEGPEEGEVSAQAHALWAHRQLYPQDRTYEVPLSLRVEGSVSPELVEVALERFVLRHEALRTFMSGVHGRPAPWVSPGAQPALALGTGGWGERLDPERGPLVRAVVTPCERGCRVDLALHHIAFDGASTTVLLRELAAMLSGKPLPPTPGIPSRCLDPMDAQPLGNGARARFGLSSGPSGQAPGVEELELPPALWSEVEALSRHLGTTPFGVITAAWALVLSRQDGETAVTIGTPANLREAWENGLVGFHTNVAVIEVEVDPKVPVGQFLRSVHRAVGKAVDERYVPYAERVACQRRSTGTPPTRTLLSIERLERLWSDSVRVTQMPVVRPRPVFDIDLTIVLGRGDGVVQIHFKAEACPRARARCLGEQLVTVVERFVSQPTLRTAAVDILPPAWRSRVVDWSCGSRIHTPERWGALAFEVGPEPDTVALTWPSGFWTRERFEFEVRRVARRLTKLKLGPGHVVAVEITPSPALAVAWHAIHRIGAAVLALDPAWPRARLDYLRRHSGAGVCLISPDGLGLRVEGSVQGEPYHPRELSYLISTSGSTGQPKLVAIQGRALANELAWSAAAFPLDGRDRVLAHSAPGFDVIVWEMLGPLSWGANLVFPEPDRWYDVAHLADRIREDRVTVLQAVPSLIEALLNGLLRGTSHLRLLLSGGEELSAALPGLVARTLPGCRLVNTYGPSETTIDATFYELPPGHPSTRRVPLGRPVAGARAYVLDERLRRLPPGAWGQLAIAGSSVGLGYLGDVGATAKRFLPDPFADSPGQRMYLTGDRTRWTEDGLLEFGGRCDFQVKVRGNRVELEEVEAALRSLPRVRDAAVFLSGAGSIHAHLIGLVVPSHEGRVEAVDLHAWCASRLPTYMAPSAFVKVATIPRLANGKVAREALPLMVVGTTRETTDFHSETERKVAQAWTRTLGCEVVDRDLSFFANGGTSLLVPVLQLRLREETGHDLPVVVLFEQTSIAAQAAAIDTLHQEGGQAEVVSSGRGMRRRQSYRARARRSD